jgi:tetratricopeptide (TPR) repeat protein
MTPASLLLVFTLAASPSFEQWREEGTRAYRAKQWKAACRAFKAAARMDEKHAQTQADLGLCLSKLGQKEAAIAAQRKAVELGDSKLRLQAYYNLFRLGVKLPLPKVPELPPEQPFEPLCGVVSQDACGAMHACTYLENLSGVGGDAYQAGVMLGTDESALWNASTERYFPTGGNETWASPDLMGLLLKSSDRSYGREIDYCRDLVNDAGVLDEEACLKAREGCCELQLSSRDCTVVWADACSGRVGGVCGKEAFELPGDEMEQRRKGAAQEKKEER